MRYFCKRLKSFDGIQLGLTVAIKDTDRNVSLPRPLGMSSFPLIKLSLILFFIFLPLGANPAYQGCALTSL